MEVALLRKVNEKRHSGIVEVLEWFECADCFLVVMARPTPVMDLFDYVSKRKRLNEAEARFVSNFFAQKIKCNIKCNASQKDMKFPVWKIPTGNSWVGGIGNFIYF